MLRLYAASGVNGNRHPGRRQSNTIRMVWESFGPRRSMRPVEMGAY